MLDTTSRPPGRRTFADGFDPKNNAFGFFRLLLAILVIFSHCFPLGGFGSDPLQSFTQGKHSIGLVSVTIFFVLSGFLICRSASRSPSVGRFLWHRLLRIYPAYWACLFLSACLFAPLAAYFRYGSFLTVFSVPVNSAQSFLMSNATLFHLNGLSIDGLLFLGQTDIAGLLSGNPYPDVINGSLWSLPFEVTCYLAVALLGAVGVIRHRRYVFLGFFVGLWGLYALNYLDRGTFYECFPYPGRLCL